MLDIGLVTLSVSYYLTSKVSLSILQFVVKMWGHIERSRLGVTFFVKASRLTEKKVRIIKRKTQLWQENDYGYG